MHFGRNGPRLTQLVECLTVVGKHASLADIRMSPVQVRERGPINRGDTCYLPSHVRRFMLETDLSYDLVVKEFRKIHTNDICDMQYDKGHNHNGPPWSRVYEYPMVVERIEKHHKGGEIHNSCWGWCGVHVQFKEILDSHFPEKVIHSDIRESDLNGTCIYDITMPPPEEFKERFDIVLNVSTMEEVDHNHLEVFSNLFKQVKLGGVLIATFDLPGLQVNSFEKAFSEEFIVDGVPINGLNSKLSNPNYEHLNCGIMVIHKRKKKLLKRILNFFR